MLTVLQGPNDYILHRGGPQNVYIVPNIGVLHQKYHFHRNLGFWYWDENFFSVSYNLFENTYIHILRSNTHPKS